MGTGHADPPASESQASTVTQQIRKHRYSSSRNCHWSMSAACRQASNNSPAGFQRRPSSGESAAAQKQQGSSHSVDLANVPNQRPENAGPHMRSFYDGRRYSMLPFDASVLPDLCTRSTDYTVVRKQLTPLLGAQVFLPSSERVEFRSLPFWPPERRY